MMRNTIRKGTTIISLFLFWITTSVFASGSCEYSYPDGSTCGRPVGSNSVFCDQHFNELNSIYNDLYNSMEGEKSFSTSSSTNKYGTSTAICAHPGCNNYVASTGDTNCCTVHSNRCLECGKYIDEDAYYCMSCLTNGVKSSGSGSSDNGSVRSSSGSTKHSSNETTVKKDKYSGECYSEVDGMATPDGAIDGIKYLDKEINDDAIIYTYDLGISDSANDRWKQYQSVLSDKCGLAFDTDINGLTYVYKGDKLISVIGTGYDEKLEGYFLSVSFNARDNISVKKEIETSTEKKYSDAEILLEEKRYDEAIEAFKALGDYSDAKERIEECYEGKYNEAEKLLEEKEFDKACDLFKELGDYSDSKTRIEDCYKGKYQTAEGLLKSGEYEEAHDLFIALGDFSDAPLRAQECIDKQNEHNAEIQKQTYDKAISLRDAEKYDDAIKTFTEILSYADAETQIKLCKALKFAKAKQGDVLDFGTYSNNGNGDNVKNDLNWRVLYREGNSLLLIAEECIGERPFQKNQNDTKYYIDSPIRNYLNKSFLNDAFTAEQQEMLETHDLPTTGGNVSDKVFLLSDQEAELYFKSDEDRAFDDGKIWFLRTVNPVVLPITNNTRLIAMFVKGGEIIQNENSTDYKRGIRPAIWLNVSSFVQEAETMGFSISDSITGENLSFSEITDTQIIEAVQIALNDSGYDCGYADGICGENTRSAIREYQGENGLEVTGIIDNGLLDALGIDFSSKENLDYKEKIDYVVPADIKDEFSIGDATFNLTQNWYYELAGGSDQLSQYNVFFEKDNAADYIIVFYIKDQMMVEGDLDFKESFEQANDRYEMLFDSFGGMIIGGDIVSEEAITRDDTPAYHRITHNAENNYTFDGYAFMANPYDCILVIGTHYDFSEEDHTEDLLSFIQNINTRSKADDYIRE